MNSVMNTPVEVFLADKDVTSLDIISQRPWSTVWRATLGTGLTRILKQVKSPDMQAGKLPELLSRRCPGACPDLVASQPDQGLFLYEDLDLDQFTPPMEPTSAAILLTYASIQSQLVNDAELATVLEPFAASEMIQRVLDLTSAAPDSIPGNVLDMMEAQPREASEAILHRFEKHFHEFVEASDALPKTLNHTDLNVGNAHQRKSGQICLIDWEDAVLAAPGLSLHMLFSGVTPLAQALDDSTGTSKPSLKAQMLNRYVKALSATGEFDKDMLRECLPKSAALGILKFMADMAPFAVRSTRTRHDIGNFAYRRLRDLSEFMEVQSAGKQRSATPPARQASTMTSAFPEWRLEPSERNVDDGVAIYRENGALLIRNCVEPTELIAVRNEMDEKWSAYERDITNDGALKVGDKRYMVSLDTGGALGSPSVLTPRSLMLLFDQLLGYGFILGSLTAVVSLPGAVAQRWHRDNDALFPETDNEPASTFSVAAIIPLVETGADIGATQIALGSHTNLDLGQDERAFATPQPSLGDCYLMDCRVMHRGLANVSKIKRPILSLVFQRPWYRDYQNFNKQAALTVTDETVRRLPAERHGLISWAVNQT